MTTYPFQYPLWGSSDARVQNERAMRELLLMLVERPISRRPVLQDTFTEDALNPILSSEIDKASLSQLIRSYISVGRPIPEGLSPYLLVLVIRQEAVERRYRVVVSRGRHMPPPFRPGC